MSLTKAHIIERIYKETDISRVKAADLVDLVFKLLKDTLSQGEKLKSQILEIFLFSTKDNVLAAILKRECAWKFLHEEL